MLDNETKRKIDSARDILVGKVPDPKAQVEQITTALIYKFMDDMDKESEELGGKSRFFTKEYEQYSWSKILDSKFSGFERLNLYADAIMKMSQNPYIPQLFRDIFKDAFLPYRDPETLNLFLKEINGFTYEHSENLGNAYEYLLSILSSQGDAGQFRTPRHIIDFIVEVISPQKNETILDPACGTAGFLISAYKHILRQNTKEKLGDKLTPDEKKKLMNNFVGYDISPDMVRLSLVNMYLHDFPNPNIYEYDTLTSENKWDETYDVILANPPFMTPKGGIRPHKRFSIKANRSEVLFVDYIAEHLNINGRAGVIVPEGIIFQSANAYKSLRKTLIENNYLYTVVSLPAGVFQPYSGVKTSILLFDKVLAKKAKDILFVKIENDGYDLGAQRRPIDKNNLPKALEIIKKYKIKIANNEKTFVILSEVKNLVYLVTKEKISESGDYNLSGDRYRETVVNVNLKWELVELGELVDVLDNQRKPVKKGDRKVGQYPYYGATGILDYVDEYIFDEKLVLLGEDGAKWGKGEETAFIAEGKYWVNNHAHVLRTKKDKLVDVFLVYILNEMDLTQYITGVTVPKLNQEKMKSIKIPLPPIEIQKQIVAEIDNYQKIIDGAKQIVSNYKPTIKIDPNWEMVELGKACLINNKIINPEQEYGESLFHYIDISSVENGTGKFSLDNKIKGSTAPSRAKRKISNGDVLLSTVRPNLKAFAYLTDIPNNSVASTGFAVLTPTTRISGKYIYYMLFEEFILSQMIERMEKGAYPSINQKDVEQIKIPLPPLEIQKQIVSQIEEEQKLVEANKKLIEIFEKKIKEKISEVWGE